MCFGGGKWFQSKGNTWVGRNVIYWIISDLNPVSVDFDALKGESVYRMVCKYCFQGFGVLSQTHFWKNCGKQRASLSCSAGKSDPISSWKKTWWHLCFYSSVSMKTVKMWQYDVEPCCCISLQIKLVKTWISYFLLLHAEPFKLCFAKRSEVICRQPKWEPWLHRLWMLVVCSGLLIYKGVYSVRKLLR